MSINNEVTMLNELADRIENEAEHAETSADIFGKALDINQNDNMDREKTRGVILDFIHSYRNKSKETLDVTQWENEFTKYPSIWKNDDERKAAAAMIVECVQSFEIEKRKLAECRKKGISHESQLKSSIENGAKAQVITNFSKYASEIDYALEKAYF